VYMVEVGSTEHIIIMKWGIYQLATTAELREIIEALELVDIGDAASYLGEECAMVEESPVSEHTALLTVDDTEPLIADDSIAC
jgi:hypothetical protein